MANENHKILQWNSQGVANKKDELCDMIQRGKYTILAVQETMLSDRHKFRLPNFQCIRRSGHYNRRAHGGVAVFYHDSVPAMEVSITSEIQAVAVRVQLHKLITICSVYSSRSHNISVRLLDDLYSQLPKPVIIMGDFNGYNHLWGSQSTDARGRDIEAFINSKNLTILNDGSPTRVSSMTKTAIDLTLTSPELAADIQWRVDASPGDSDHCPISLEILSETAVEEPMRRMNFRRADWGLFTASEAWENIEQINASTTTQELLDDLYSRIDTASDVAIPTVTVSRFFPKPWWSARLKQSRDRRERLYHIFRARRSVQNVINWKKARAEHKKLVKEHKEESWKQMAQSFNQNTPMNKVWENIRRINGKRAKKINILCTDGNQLTTKREIAEKLAETFAEISTDDHYCAEFRHIKYHEESQPIDLTSANDEYYNQDFSMPELERALESCSDTAPGLDNVNYKMINSLPAAVKKHILNIFNRIYREGYFPRQWKESVIIPIPKPEKNHADPTNYRPISLTSNLGKTLERMINNRLLDFLDTVPGFGNVQAGGRRRRSTIDHLVRLESAIRKAFINNEHMISIFFDLEKAYDTTWRHGILLDLLKLGLKGRLPIIIAEFLRERFFRVRVDSAVSTRRVQENGIPQGSVLSVTLFIIKIDSIARQIPSDGRFLTSLYVDDLQVSYSHPNIRVIQHKLQETLNNIAAWATENGFKFSAAKTKAVLFSKVPGLYIPPTLKINNSNIPFATTMKFLGMIWDEKLTWQPHITKLKATCSRSIGLLKSLAATEWGADQVTLMHLYRALIRSKLDYGQIVYASASNTVLKQLDSIAGEAMRIASGAFKSSPIESLQVLLNEKPLEMRRETATLKYFYKIRSELNNPAYKQINDISQRRLYEHKREPYPVAIRAQHLIEKLTLRKSGIKPSFSYRILNINIPTWKIEPPDVNLHLASYKKGETSCVAFQQLFGQLVQQEYSNAEHIYTDGSKFNDTVGAAVVYGDIVRRSALPREASIYTAEKHAIHMAGKLVMERDIQGHYVIFSDSLSTLTCIRKLEYKDTLIRKLQHDFYQMKQSGIVVSLCWIPGHVGIRGNNAVDDEAKRAARNLAANNIFFSIPYTDFYPIIEKGIRDLWYAQWQRSNAKLKSIKNMLGPWKCRKSRSEQVKINRLRIGHTAITHGYLMDNTAAPGPPICELCQQTILTVKHILVDCVNLEDLRERYFGRRIVNIGDLLSDDCINEGIFNFLRHINVYSQL